jgi:hypothetical protein
MCFPEPVPDPVSGLLFCIYPVHKWTGTLSVPCLRAFQNPVVVGGMQPQVCGSTKPLDEQEH